MSNETMAEHDNTAVWGVDEWDAGRIRVENYNDDMHISYANTNVQYGNDIVVLHQLTDGSLARALCVALADLFGVELHPAGTAQRLAEADGPEPQEPDDLTELRERAVLVHDTIDADKRYIAETTALIDELDLQLGALVDNETCLAITDEMPSLTVDCPLCSCKRDAVAEHIRARIAALAAARETTINAVLQASQASHEADAALRAAEIRAAVAAAQAEVSDLTRQRDELRAELMTARTEAAASRAPIDSLKRAVRELVGDGEGAVNIKRRSFGKLVEIALPVMPCSRDCVYACIQTSFCAGLMKQNGAKIYSVLDALAEVLPVDGLAVREEAPDAQTHPN